jgi:integrase
MASIRPRYSKHGGHLIGYQVRIDRIKKGLPPVHFAKLYDTKAEAEREAAIVESEIARGQYQDRREVEATTLGEALDRYEREISSGKKTHDKEKGMITRLRKHDLAHRSIASLRGVDFAGYRDERLAAGLANNSVRLELALLRHLWTIGIKEWGWPVVNPIASIRLPIPAKGRERRLSRDLSPAAEGEEPKTEETRLLEACQASRSKFLEPIVRLALATGMRQGEILGLEWERIDLEKKTAHLPDTKNGTARTVPLSSVAVGVLKGLLPGGDADNVTPLKAMTGLVFPIGQMGVVHAFERACKKAGIAGLRFHDLRHEATSRFFERGLGIQEVAAITGHKTLQMLKRYTHLRAEDLAAKLG